MTYDQHRSVETCERKQTILFVDDEEPLQQVIQEILGRRGYHVLVAGDGPQAIAASKDFSGPIHLLLTDVVMPRMHGWEVVRSLSIQRPAIKVLYMSGYSESILFERHSPTSGQYFLQKPFLPDILVDKIREVLDDPVQSEA